jgi:uroporphyrin-III C-methyltransferase
MGRVYFVGAGPGAPDLITLRGARLLDACDVVLYDALVHPEVVALARSAQPIAVGKRCGDVSTDQRFINRLLVEMASRYAKVVRLKGGDPLLFARAREEFDALEAARIDYEVVPGVTAALAAAADLKIPLTERGVSRSVTFATARVGTQISSSLSTGAPAGGDTLLHYMGVGEMGRVLSELLDRGMPPDTPVTVMENASLPNARSFHGTLSRPPFVETVAGPAILGIGSVFRRPADENANTEVAAAGRLA